GESVVALARSDGAPPIASGVVIGAAGPGAAEGGFSEASLIVTALSAVGESGPLVARLADGRRAPATRLGHDVVSGVALLSAPIEAPPVLAAAPEPPMGAPICVFGASFGDALAAACGIVAATHVSGVGAAAAEVVAPEIQDFLQLDVAAAPASRGGAALDAQGRLIGLIAQRAPAESGAAAAFAIPAALLLRAAAALTAGEDAPYVAPGWRLAPLGPRLSARLAGAEIVAVSPGGPAATAGLRRGDVVLSVGGRALRGPADARGALARLAPGAAVEIILLRQARRETKTLRFGTPAAPALENAAATAEPSGADNVAAPEGFGALEASAPNGSGAKGAIATVLVARRAPIESAGPASAPERPNAAAAQGAPSEPAEAEDQDDEDRSFWDVILP
ncbi:MAG: S1C family serine protease, partial [Pseudomonadota bacterium]